MSTLELMGERPVLILGTLVTAGAMLAGCGQEPAEPPVQLGVYKDVKTCVADGYDKGECQRAFETAREKVKELAPRYASKADCEEDYGAEKCEGAFDSTQTFVADGMDHAASAPAATHSSGGGHATVIYPYSYYHPYYSGFTYGSSGSGSSYHAQPVFSNVAGQPHLANGQPVNYGKAAVPAHMASPQAPAKFAPGQSVAKGAAPVGHAAAHSHAAPAPRPSGFGSIGRGFSGGG